jgi:pyrimidine-nucleoside phosphorylase
LYGLRDVTGTVDSIPLIASSVMSKKIAAGAQAILLDVKVGLGAFMHSLENARRLSELMVSIGQLAGRQVIALLSDMNQPLGCAVGNALEVREAIDTLHGSGPEDFREHCLLAAGYLLALGGKAQDEIAGRSIAERVLKGGGAWERFKMLVAAQGGDVSYVEHPDKLPAAPLVETVPAPRTGYLQGVHARLVGETSVLLGAGRAVKGEPIDHSVGIVIDHKVGDWVEAGQPLFTVHAHDPQTQAEARERLLEAHTWSDTPVEPLPLFYGVVRSK